MQKFKAKLKNVPTNAPQVCSSINSQLNKEETLSVENGHVVNDKLTLNIPDVDQAVKADALPLKSEILWSRCKPYNIQKVEGLHLHL